MKFFPLLLALLCLVGSGLTFFALFASPNMARMVESGPGWMIERAREQPLEGVVFLALPLFAVAQLATAIGLALGRGEKWLVGFALVSLALDALGVAVVILLAAGSSAAGGGH